MTTAQAATRGARLFALCALLVALPSTPVATAAAASPSRAPRELRLASGAAATRPDTGASGAPAEPEPRWTPYARDTANRVVFERPTPDSPWSIRLVTRRVDTSPDGWHVSATVRGQVLQEILPRTAYVLRFRARASARRPVRLELHRQRPAYLNLGLRREVMVDATPRAYEVRFLTADSIPPLREPSSSGVWLMVGAGQARGTVWLGDVTLAPAVPLRFEDRPLALAAFAPGECWDGGEAATRGGAAGLVLATPANGSAFAARELPLDLERGAWDMVLRVHTAAPANVGRIVVLVRSGSDDGRAYAFWSFSGLAPGWNRVVIPRERFLSYTWQGRFAWAAARTLAIKLESNDNGAARVTLGRLSVEPRAEGRRLAPVITRINVQRVGPRRAQIAWTTDVPATCALDRGPTPAYGRSRALAGRSTRHVADLDSLAPGRTYHCRVRAAGADGARARSGDFTFVTDPAAPWIAARAGRRFPLGLSMVTTVADVEHARATDFDWFMSYRFSSCVEPDSEARAYLDAAATAGKRALVGFCTPSVARGDTVPVLARVRALERHPGLLGWYLYDEPEGDRADSAALRQVYAAVHREDPAHPVFIGAYALGPAYPYREACDFAFVSRYPVPFQPVETLVPLLRDARAAGEDFGFGFQSYATEYQRWPGSYPGPGRYPAKREMRAMAWLGVVFGAKALGTFAYSWLHDTPGSEWHWAELLSVARELRLLEPLLLAPEAEATRVASVSDTAIHACVRSLDGTPYAIAVNVRPERVRASLALVGPALAGATEIFERRSVRIAGGTLADTWPPFGVRIYALDTR